MRLGVACRPPAAGFCPATAGLSSLGWVRGLIQKESNGVAGSANTIFALSTAPGKAGVAVVRISGPEAAVALMALCGSPMPEARTAALRRIRHPRTGEELDRGLVLWFPQGASFTGESSAELQVHGSRAVVAAILDALSGLPGCRMAEPGEFTRRAFESGRLDLAQVEALDDLIAADTAVQRCLALRGLEGRLGARVALWRGELLLVRSLLAAEIDFSDEGDVGEAAAEIDSVLLRLIADMEGVLAASGLGRIVAGGYRVAILGKPNSGKSSLLNALSGTDAAIVSAIAGTTRDVIEIRLDWDGYEVVLADTAGLRATDDPVEAIGIARALERAGQADLCIVIDPEADWSGLPAALEGVDSIRVRSKSDLVDGTDRKIADDTVSLSVLTGEGLGVLRQAIIGRIRGKGALESILVTRTRQCVVLAQARDALRRAVAVTHASVELRDHEVRSAEAALEMLLGRIGVEEMLGAVFGRFCIGK
jgi:tRNA modification GTPase